MSEEKLSDRLITMKRDIAWKIKRQPLSESEFGRFLEIFSPNTTEDVSALECAGWWFNYRSWGIGHMKAYYEALRIAWCKLADRIVIHSLSKPAVELIFDTDVEKFPTAKPMLFEKPWVVESKDGSPLFEVDNGPRVFSVAGVQIGVVTIIYVTTEDCESALLARVKWGGTFDNIISNISHIQDTDNPDIEHPFSKPAATATLLKFIIKLGLTLEAEQCPLGVKDEVVSHKKMPSRHTFRPVHVVTRYVNLTPHSSAQRKLNRSAAVINDALVNKKIFVRGHLRNQACGPKHAERKLIYIEEHYSSYRTHGVPVKVVVNAQEART